MPFALLVAGLIVGGMCALLALNTASAANEVTRHDIAARDQGIAAQIVQLQNEVQDSSAPANLAAAAAALGMVTAGDPAFLEIGPDGKVRLLGSPGPASAAPVNVPSPTPAASKPKPTAGAKPKAKTSGTKTTGTKTTATKPTRTKTTGTKTRTASTTSTTAPTRPAASTRTAHAKTPTPTPTPETTLPGGTR